MKRERVVATLIVLWILVAYVDYFIQVIKCKYTQPFINLFIEKLVSIIGVLR